MSAMPKHERDAEGEGLDTPLHKSKPITKRQMGRMKSKKTVLAKAQVSSQEERTSGQADNEEPGRKRSKSLYDDDREPPDITMVES